MMNVFQQKDLFLNIVSFVKIKLHASANYELCIMNTEGLNEA